MLGFSGAHHLQQTLAAAFAAAFYLATSTQRTVAVKILRPRTRSTKISKFCQLLTSASSWDVSRSSMYFFHSSFDWWNNRRRVRLYFYTFLRSGVTDGRNLHENLTVAGTKNDDHVSRWWSCWRHPIKDFLWQLPIVCLVRFFRAAFTETVQ